MVLKKQLLISSLKMLAKKNRKLFFDEMIMSALLCTIMDANWLILKIYWKFILSFLKPKKAVPSCVLSFLSSVFVDCCVLLLLLWHLIICVVCFCCYGIWLSVFSVCVAMASAYLCCLFVLLWHLIICVVCFCCYGIGLSLWYLKTFLVK